jgi:hypothetical protein
MPASHRSRLPSLLTRALKPPAVPALMIRSGLKVWQARYVARLAGTVPMRSTLCSLSWPDHTTCTSKPQCWPE